MSIVQRLVKHLPEEFMAEPRVHLGTLFEIDVCAYEDNERESHVRSQIESVSGGTATAVWSAPAPTSVAE